MRNSPHYALRLVSSRAYDGCSHELIRLFHAPVRLGVATQPARKVLGFIQWFAGLRQSTGRLPLRQAHQKSGSFPPPALPDINGRMTLSDSRQHRHPAATSRPLPSCQAGLPQLPGSPFQRAVPNTPMDRNRCVCRLLPCPPGPSPFLRRVGVHDFTFGACSGFTRVTACWIAQPPKAAFVTRLQSSRLPDQTARQLPGPTDNFLGGSFLHW